MIAHLKRTAHSLARIEITIALAIAAGALAIWNAETGGGKGVWLAAPAAGMFVNLCAALLVNRTLSAQPALFAFHMGLAALALALSADALTSFSGHVEVTEDTAFEPALVVGSARPFHANRLDRIRFRQKSFDIAYAPGMSRRDTKSSVEIPEGRSWRKVTVGDDTPLVFSPYRLYTSFNKGFAPVITYTDARGVKHSGAVHLPSYPLNEDRQGNVWTPPGSATPMAIWLRFDNPVYRTDAAWRFVKPADARLIVIFNGARHELEKGESVALAGGVVRFEAVKTWMGYTISANPMAPLAAAAALASLLALLWHILRKLLTPLAGAPERAVAEFGHA
ncbi:MAG: cytochrome c biogenesis protein ResB [Parvularculaceae bacterium]